MCLSIQFLKDVHQRQVEQMKLFRWIKKSGYLPKKNRNIGPYWSRGIWFNCWYSAHAAGFMDFEPELERLLSEVDENILKYA